MKTKNWKKKKRW